MKCEKCGKNIANVHYKTNYNGKVTEKHLCSECAKTEKLDMFDDFDDMFTRMDDLLEAPFRGLSRAFSGGFGMMPLMMPTMLLPRFEIRYDEDTSENTEAKADNVRSEEKASVADPEISKKRELNMLKAQLHEAVMAEKYEDAITLRDKIRELEK